MYRVYSYDTVYKSELSQVNQFISPSYTLSQNNKYDLEMQKSGILNFSSFSFLNLLQMSLSFIIQPKNLAVF